MIQVTVFAVCGRFWRLFGDNLPEDLGTIGHVEIIRPAAFMLTRIARVLRPAA